MDRREVLETALQLVTQDRDKEHGDARSNFVMIAGFWSAYTGADISPRDVAAMMAMLKVARFKSNPGNPDNCPDGAGYLGLASEMSD